MTEGYGKLNPTVTQIAVAVTDGSIAGTKHSLGTWNVAIHLALFKNTSVSKHQTLVSTDKPEVLLHCPTEGYVNYPALCHNLLHRDLGHLPLSQVVTVVLWISTVMLIGSGEPKIAISRCVERTYMCQEVQDNPPAPPPNSKRFYLIKMSKSPVV